MERENRAVAKNWKAEAIGSCGELIADHFLIDSRYQVIDKNWRRKLGEIDIVAISPDGELTFVEVKTRSSQRFGLGVEAISREKYQRIYLLGLHWCRENNFPPKFRVDVISIDNFVFPMISHIRRVIL